MKTRKIKTEKTGRYFLEGEITSSLKQVWFICHGYGQLGSFFLKNFAPPPDGSILLVSCEGLHRFYTNGFSGRIGASWMTREDREDDILDYVSFLKNVYAQVMEEVKKQTDADIRITAFGFSQGTATVCRWINEGQSEFHRLVLWAGAFPPDVDTGLKKDLFSRLKTILVLGDQDEFIKEDGSTVMHEQLDKAGIPYELIRFSGKHELHQPTLEMLMNF